MSGLKKILSGALSTLDRHVPGKPRSVSIPGLGEVEARPIKEIEASADRYMDSVGRPGAHRLDAYEDFDEGRAARIAEAFERMKHDPADPKVKRSYDALIDETLAQYDSLKDSGIEYKFLKDGQGDPYAKSPALGYADIIQNGRLWVFPTDQGFGSSGLFDPSDNPLLKRVGKVGDLDNATANDAFRIVHDAYGHFGPGNPFFRHKGEERAWQQHSKMFSDDALPAMSTETRGQNSWLNFGPHAAHNRTALGGDTVFADQKIGLLPEWAYKGYASGGMIEPMGYAGGGMVSRIIKPKNAVRMTDELRRAMKADYAAQQKGPAFAGWLPGDLIEEGVQGVVVGAPSTLDRFLGYGWGTLDDLAAAYPRTRDHIGELYGENPVFYRADAPKSVHSDRVMTLRFGDEPLARKFEDAERRAAPYVLPLDGGFLAGHHSPRADYYEFIGSKAKMRPFDPDSDPVEGYAAGGFVKEMPKDDLVEDATFVGSLARGSKKILGDLHGKVLVPNDLPPAERNRIERELWGEKGVGVTREGLPMFEIDDSAARLKDLPDFGPEPENFLTREEYRAAIKAWEPKRSAAAPMTLQDAIDHPELFDQMPDLAKLPFRYDRSMPQAQWGALESELGGKPVKMLIDPRRPSEDILSSILHETQHGIQSIEGWQRGSNLYSAEALVGRQNRLEEKLLAAQTMRDMLEGGVTPDELRASMDFTHLQPKDRLEAIELSKTLSAPSIEQMYQEARKGRAAFDDVYGTYQRNDGEMMARNTQTRQPLSADERRATFWKDTEDRKGEPRILMGKDGEAKLVWD